MKRYRFNDDFYDHLKSKSNRMYLNSNSVMKDFDKSLASLGYHHGLDEQNFFKSIEGKKELEKITADFFHKSIEINEKEFFAEALYHIGHKPLASEITRLFLNHTEYATWSMGDLLYKINDLSLIDDYYTIVKDKSFGPNRQMIVLLIGKVPKKKSIDTLISVFDDKEIEGHIVSALSNFKDSRIIQIMQSFSSHNEKWIKTIANNYLQHNV